MTDIHNNSEELRSVLVDLYYKGYHEGKGDIPNMDDVEITQAQAALTHWRDRAVVEGRFVELDLLEQAINADWDMNTFKLRRLADLKERLDKLGEEQIGE